MQKTAGYSGTPLAKKLGIKEGFRIGLLGEPLDYIKLLIDLPDGIHWHNDLIAPNFDMVHFFVSSKAQYLEILEKAKLAIKKSGAIWVSWPKRSSGIQTDLDENSIRDIALDMGLVDVKVCAIDNTWSGLKLIYKLKDR